MRLCRIGLAGSSLTLRNSSAALSKLRGKLESLPSAPLGVTVMVASLRSMVSNSLAPAVGACKGWRHQRTRRQRSHHMLDCFAIQYTLRERTREKRRDRVQDGRRDVRFGQVCDCQRYTPSSLSFLAGSSGGSDIFLFFWEKYHSNMLSILLLSIAVGHDAVTLGASHAVAACCPPNDA